MVQTSVSCFLLELVTYVARYRYHARFVHGLVSDWNPNLRSDPLLASGPTYMPIYEAYRTSTPSDHVPARNSFPIGGSAAQRTIEYEERREGREKASTRGSEAKGREPRIESEEEAVGLVVLVRSQRRRRRWWRRR